MSIYGLRQVQLSDISDNFEQVLHKARMGVLPKENVVYFLVLAKRFFEKNIETSETEDIKKDLQDKAKKMDELIKEWQYWSNLERLVSESKSSSNYRNLLFSIEKILKKENITKNDSEIRFFMIKDDNFYKSYIINLLNIHRRKLLYNILSEIWVIIYGFSVVEDTDIADIVTGLIYDKAKEDAKNKGQLFEEVQQLPRVAVASEERKAARREVEPTPICLRSILGLMNPFLEELRQAYFKESEFENRYYNAESYVFSLLMVSEKVLEKETEKVIGLDEVTQKAFKLLDKHEEYKFLQNWRKLQQLDSRLETLYLNLEQQISSEMLEIFTLTENVRDIVSVIGVTEEETKSGKKGVIVNYRRTRDLTEYEKTHLVGFQLVYNQLITFFEQLRRGTLMRQVQVKCSPYAININDLPGIILIIGKTGCLSKGTEIYVPNHKPEIMNLSEVYQEFGEKPFYVYSYNFRIKKSEIDIARIIPSGRKQLYKITFKSGRQVLATSEHTFFRINNTGEIEEVPLSLLRIRDKLFVNKYLRTLEQRERMDEIVSIEPVSDDETYDLQVEKNNNFTLANKLVVHNSGKTVHAITYVYMFTKENYTVFDCSLNIDRAGEMLFSILPVDKSNRELFEKVTDFQQMIPEGIPSIVLIPYVEESKLPERIPACAKIITIPLCTLAKKISALALLFTTMPSYDAIDLVNTVLIEKADKTWDLETLRSYLTTLLHEKNPIIEIKEKYDFSLSGEQFKFDIPREIEIDKNVVRRALKSMVKKSSLISSGLVETAIDFDELAQGGYFVTPYYGHIADRAVAMAFNRWFTHSVIDYKSAHLNKKITIFINEAQEVAPSQALVGGLLSEEKFSLAIDIASRCLQWRGLGFHALILSQQASQLRQQFQTQAGLKIIFNTENDEELKFAFGNLANQELAENLKAVMRSKLSFDEHMCVYVIGTEDVKILVGALPPCALERSNIDPFVYYLQQHKPIRHTSEYIKLIEMDKLKRTLKVLGVDFVKQVLQNRSEDKILSWLNEDETITKKKTLEEMQKIPEGKTLISTEKLEKMQEIGENETITDKEKVEKYEKYEDVIEQLNVVDKMQDLPDSYKKQDAVIFCLTNIVLGCTKNLVFDIEKIQKWMETLGRKCSYVTIYLAMRDKLSKHLILKNVLKQTNISGGNKRFWELDEYNLKEIKEKIGSEHLEKVYKYCAKFCDKLPELPWSDEILKLRQSR